MIAIKDLQKANLVKTRASITRADIPELPAESNDEVTTDSMLCSISPGVLRYIDEYSSYAFTGNVVGLALEVDKAWRANDAALANYNNCMKTAN